MLDAQYTEDPWAMAAVIADRRLGRERPDVTRFDEDRHPGGERRHDVAARHAHIRSVVGTGEELGLDELLLILGIEIGEE